MDLEDETNPDVAPWPTSVEMMRELSRHPSARCLRVRIAAIQEVLTEFSNTAIVRWLCLWLDQHVPLLLALERGDAVPHAADDPDLDPIDREPLLPEMPEDCRHALPMLWATKSATALKKWPFLKLLWKAAPRKCHSKDVEALVTSISRTSSSMAALVQSIHKASLLGNYAHARKRPPLPLRFAIYRRVPENLVTDASSKHPFFLYSLKEFLVSAVAEDFGLRHELARNTNWAEFESRVIECCDRMIRPYSSIAPVVSARMLLSQGKGATLPSSAMAPQAKKAQAMAKKMETKLASSSEDVMAPTVRGVTYEEWKLAVKEGDEAKARLVTERVLPMPVPFHSWPLPKHIYDAQNNASHPPVPKASVHVCETCRGGFFVGHSVGGKKCEALGDVLTEKWHCPVCKGTPVLQSVSLVGQVVQCSTGTFTACTKCPFPLRFFDSGLVCPACTKATADAAENAKAPKEKRACWHEHCSRSANNCFLAVPFGGLDPGQEWETLCACSVHTFPNHLTAVPIPRDKIKRMWWAWKRGL